MASDIHSIARTSHRPTSAAAIVPHISAVHPAALVTRDVLLLPEAAFLTVQVIPEDAAADVAVTNQQSQRN